MQSFIICGGSYPNRLQKITSLASEFRADEKLTKQDILSRTDPDVLLVEPSPSIGIADVKALKNALHLKPFASRCQIAVITAAQKLTVEAQNALLKSLEEPKPNAYLFLEIANPAWLLPTIRSRCQEIIIAGSLDRQSTPNLSAETLLNTLPSQSPGQRIAAVATVHTKSQAENLLSEILHILHEHRTPSESWVSATKLTQEAIAALAANLNPRLVVEHFALHYPQNQFLPHSHSQSAP